MSNEPKLPDVEPEHPDFLRQWKLYFDAVMSQRQAKESQPDCDTIEP